jgi:hypothetical protein
MNLLVLDQASHVQVHAYYADKAWDQHVEDFSFR